MRARRPNPRTGGCVSQAQRAASVPPKAGRTEPPQFAANNYTIGVRKTQPFRAFFAISLPENGQAHTEKTKRPVRIRGGRALRARKRVSAAGLRLRLRSLREADKIRRPGFYLGPLNRRPKLGDVPAIYHRRLLTPYLHGNSAHKGGGEMIKN